MGAKLIWRQHLAIIAAENSKGIKLKFRPIAHFAG